MIRSLREDKRQYRRQHRRRLRPSGGDGVPFMIYERFIAELFRARSRTHKAAVQMNMVSSYGAARDRAILSDELHVSGDRESERHPRMRRGGGGVRLVGRSSRRLDGAAVAVVPRAERP